MKEEADEIKRLRAVITRAKDALLDGQSTQRVHDLLVAGLVERTEASQMAIGVLGETGLEHDVDRS
jgi:hypothetical protein